MRSLETLQLRFAAAFDQTPAAIAHLLPLMKSPRPLTARRFKLYLNNSAHAWHRALSHTYPILKALVGASCFRAIARDYSQVCGSKSSDLNEFGAYFSEFIRDLESVAQYPYFADMARLEWHLHCAYYAADGTASSVGDWTALTSKKIAHARVKFHPAFNLITSKWAVIDIWHAHQLANPIWPTQIERANYGMIVRPMWRAEVVLLAPDAFEALNALYHGHTVEEAIACALAVNPDFDFLSNLRRWIKYAIFIQILSDPNNPNLR